MRSLAVEVGALHQSPVPLTVADPASALLHMGALLGGDLRPDLLPEKEEEEDSSELSLAGASSTSIHVTGGCPGCCAARPLRAREAPAAADPPLPRLAAVETDAGTASGEGGGSRRGERRPAAAEKEAGAQQRRR
ncbi:hypothetical protein [Oryza sativa Japonica Group]|uniref:Uncharacterized protein n=1 Tax=Oryza sativa subsp. japonica TaxID=39947 RepID=Q94D64_ORYSJ|nr:hypothetical protein [Oryza sativa Japonica Group]